MNYNGHNLFIRGCKKCNGTFWTTARFGKVCSKCNQSKNKKRYELSDEEMRKWIKKKKKMKTKRQWMGSS